MFLNISEKAIIIEQEDTLQICWVYWAEWIHLTNPNIFINNSFTD